MYASYCNIIACPPEMCVKAFVLFNANCSSSHVFCVLCWVHNHRLQKIIDPHNWKYEFSAIFHCYCFACSAQRMHANRFNAVFLFRFFSPLCSLLWLMRIVDENKNIYTMKHRKKRFVFFWHSISSCWILFISYVQCLIWMEWKWVGVVANLKSTTTTQQNIHKNKESAFNNWNEIGHSIHSSLDFPI